MEVRADVALSQTGPGSSGGMATGELFHALWVCRDVFNGAVVVNSGAHSLLHSPAMPARYRHLLYNYRVRPQLRSPLLLLKTLKLPCCKLLVYLSACSQSGTLQVAECDDADTFPLPAAGAHSRGDCYMCVCVCVLLHRCFVWYWFDAMVQFPPRRAEAMLMYYQQASVRIDLSDRQRAAADQTRGLLRLVRDANGVCCYHVVYDIV